MRYCPLCDAEYSEAHTRCTVCGVVLVPEEFRGRPLDEQQRKERIELVWRGGDPGAVSEVIEILRAAGIRHHVQATNDHFVFELGMPRPKYVVRTFASDAVRAKELLAGIHDSSPFVAMEASALALADEPLEEQIHARMRGRPPRLPWKSGVEKMPRSRSCCKTACGKTALACALRESRPELYSFA